MDRSISQGNEYEHLKSTSVLADGRSMLNGVMADNCVCCSSPEDGVPRAVRLLRRRSGDLVSSYLYFHDATSMSCHLLWTGRNTSLAAVEVNATRSRWWFPLKPRQESISQNPRANSSYGLAWFYSGRASSHPPATPLLIHSFSFHFIASTSLPSFINSTQFPSYLFEGFFAHSQFSSGL